MSQALEPEVLTSNFTAINTVQRINPASSYSPEKAATFLNNLVDSGGNVTAAAQSINVERKTVYNWRSSIPEFSDAWEDAIEAGTENLEEIAYKRASQVSDTLAIFLLKARRPEKYRENLKIEGLEGDSSSATRELVTMLQTLTARAKELQAQPAQIPTSVSEQTP